ncbi:MAG: hypothetical protein AAF318_11490 [Pseudomonadota bacterium]
MDLAGGLSYRAADTEVPTAKRKPTIRNPAPLLAHLRRWRAAGAHHVAEWNGKPVGRVNKALARSCEAVGFEGVSAQAVTHAFQGGADEWEAMGFFGLSTETARRYAHHHPDFQGSVHKAPTGPKTGPD